MINNTGHNSNEQYILSHSILELLISMPSNMDRFTGRAKIYSSSRPSYPDGILRGLAAKTGMDRTWVVADIGAGTGKLAELFVENGNPVKCAEPNPDMRSELKVAFPGKDNVEILDGSAENTLLKEKSVDIVVCGQSFHWFRPEETGIEFRRILRRGWVALIWNNRVAEDPLTASYDRIVRKYSPEYHGTGSMSVHDSVIEKFFGTGYELMEYPNNQELNFDALIGRYLSASYSIDKQSSQFNDLMSEFRDLFDRYQRNDKVVMRYRTVMYLGRLS